MDPAVVVLSDTHARRDHRMEGRTLEAVRAADLVCHCGDFLSEPVLDAFENQADRLVAVYGNNDPPAVRERLPATRTVEFRGYRFAVAHGHEHSATALGLFGREHDADLVLVGHSHHPSVRAGDPPVLNPGSHADPRWHRPAHAEISLDPLAGRLVEPDGTLLDRFDLGGGNE